MSVLLAFGSVLLQKCLELSEVELLFTENPVFCRDDAGYISMISPIQIVGLDDIAVNPLPEPPTLAVLDLGGLALMRRRR